MRKKTISFGLDHIMWTIIYIFPILLVLFASAVTPLADVITTVNNSAFVTDFSSTQIYSVLNDIFGIDGILPLFTGTTGVAVISYMTYFVNVLIIHLAVDILVFIPRIAHEWIGKIAGGKDA